MWVNFLAFLIATGVFFSAHGLTASEASVDPRWLRLYQYRVAGSGYKSDVHSDRFFFSPEGRTNPAAELQAAVANYESDSQTWGTLKLPARCAFPARKQILESLLDRKFPNGPCPDLDSWLARVHADNASLVFVGAYAGNAASILGHTLLRISNSEREESGREGMDLLSYSVGYTAHPDPEDGRVSYMVKGLTGQYPGFYDIEPYYMKVGLYNNSESRDLWDVPLNLSKEEVDLLVRVIWEYTFNSQMEYYFIGQNCSYRLLKLLEIVRPNLSVSESFSFVVLPAESVRVLIEAGVTKPDFKFRSSIKRRLLLKNSHLSASQKEIYQRAATSVEVVREIKDATIADALLDYWLYENYKVQTHLSKESQEIMDATFARSAELQGHSEFNLSNQGIRETQRLAPPFVGHKPHWFAADVGGHGKKTAGGLEIRSGVHPFWSADRAYRDVSAIEYLGADYRWFEGGNDQWNLLLARALTLEEFFHGERDPSWGFEISFGNSCRFCDTTKASLQFLGAFGLSTRTEGWIFSLLPILKGAVWSEQGTQAALTPGGHALAKWSGERWVFVGEVTSTWKDRWLTEFEARVGYAVTKDAQPFVKIRDSLVVAGWAHFF